MSGVKDIVVATRENKLRYAGHVARLRDDRWSSIIKNWPPRERKRPVGRPPLRWREYMVKVVGQNWQEIPRIEFYRRAVHDLLMLLAQSQVHNYPKIGPFHRKRE